MTPFATPRLRILALLVLCALAAPSASALDYLDLVSAEGVRRSVQGQIIVTAADGGVLLQTAEGQFITAQPNEIAARRSDDIAFAPLTSDQVAEDLLREFGAGFEIHRTEHFLICHNTSPEYARWCGALFERLYAAFTNYWKRRDVKVNEPEFPLVALIFNDATNYARHAQKEIGPAAAQIIGYYSFGTNRMTTYDLTGSEALRAVANGRRMSLAQLFQHPQAERLVATLIHEATHQLAFNTGLQKRYADNPLWLSEGLAMYFETPDLRSSSGWRTIGAVNHLRLAQFQQNLPRRGRERLQQLICEDGFMRGEEAATIYYAEAWALCYYLIRAKDDQFRKYMAHLAAKPRLVWDDPETRLKEFEAHFGDLRTLDRDFLVYMSRIRQR
jgi:hypothetical protein